MTMIQHQKIIFLSKAECKNLDINHIFNYHRQDDCSYYSVPGEMIQKLYADKPSSFYKEAVVYCAAQHEYFLEMQFISPLGRIVTVTSRGTGRNGQPYQLDLGTPNDQNPLAPW